MVVAAVTWPSSHLPRVTVFYRPGWEVLRVNGCLSDTNSKTAVPRKPQDTILTIDAAVNTRTRASLCSGVSALNPRRGLTGSEGRAFPFLTNTAAAGPVNIRPFHQLDIPTGCPHQPGSSVPLFQGSKVVPRVWSDFCFLHW